MGSAGHSSAVPLVAARGRTARAADVLPRVLGAASLATVIATSLDVVTAAATHPLPLVPARLGGLPAWLRGPLSGPGYVLLEGDFAEGLAPVGRLEVVEHEGGEDSVEARVWVGKLLGEAAIELNGECLSGGLAPGAGECLGVGVEPDDIDVRT